MPHQLLSDLLLHRRPADLFLTGVPYPQYDSLKFQIAAIDGRSARFLAHVPLKVGPSPVTQGFISFANPFAQSRCLKITRDLKKLLYISLQYSVAVEYMSNMTIH